VSSGSARTVGTLSHPLLAVAGGGEGQKLAAEAAPTRGDRARAHSPRLNAAGVGLRTPLPPERNMEQLRPRLLRRAALLLALLPLSASAIAAMQAKPVEWTVGDQAFSGVLVYDDDSSDKRPGLVMVPDCMGVSDDEVSQAKDVAGDDYVNLVADIYGKDV